MEGYTPDGMMGAFETASNTPHAETIANIKAAIASGLPTIQVGEAKGDALIVGGGPSVKNLLWEIRARHDGLGQFVLCINGAGQYLHQNGITPDALLILDARPHNAKFLDGLPDSVHLYLASQCSPVVFEAAKRFPNVTVWHASINGAQWPEIKRPFYVVGGGTTAGLLAITVECILGYRSIHLFGMDSSYQDGEAHPYKQPENDDDDLYEVTKSGRRFMAPLWMLRQVGSFASVQQQTWLRFGATIHVHGGGLLAAHAEDLVRATERVGEAAE